MVGGAGGDEEVVAGRVGGVAGGGVIKDRLAIAPTDHRAGGLCAGADVAVGLKTPAADADHLVPFGPVGEGVVGVVDGDEAAAVFHVVNEGGLGRGGPFGALVDDHDGGVVGKLGGKAGHIGAGGRGGDDVDFEETGLLEVGFHERRTADPVVVFRRLTGQKYRLVHGGGG
jgi:hypothetical protein